MTKILEMESHFSKECSVLNSGLNISIKTCLAEGPRRSFPSALNRPIYFGELQYLVHCLISFQRGRGAFWKCSPELLRREEESWMTLDLFWALRVLYLTSVRFIAGEIGCLGLAYWPARC